MARPPAGTVPWAERATVLRPSLGALVLAAAVPPLFLHASYQPSVDLALAGSEVTLALSDVAVLAVIAAALAAARAEGAARLRPGAWIWAAGAVLLAVILVSTVYGELRFADYPVGDKLVSALKFAEYAVLAAAVPLLVRRRADLTVLLAGVVGWSVVASAVAVLQFLGFVDEFEGRRPGQREPSWVGIHDFAALSGAALSVALVLLALGVAGRQDRRLALVAWVSGAVGLVLAAALNAAAALAVVAGALAAAGSARGTLTPRRLAALAGTVAVVAAGVVGLRSADLDQFLRFLGIRPAERETVTEVQTTAQRLILVYIGGRVFLDHPVFGAGWQGSREEYAYGPYVADARARFPDQPERAFPSPEHPWGVQNVFVQALADMGVIGLAALLAVLAAGLTLAGRAVLRAPPPPVAGALALSWILFAAAALAVIGLISGIPSDALLWLGLGLAVAAQELPA